MKASKLCRLVLPAAMLVGFVGCGEQAGVKEETKVTSPGGTTTTTSETKVKSTGENPPPPAETPSTAK